MRINRVTDNAFPYWPDYSHESAWDCAVEGADQAVLTLMNLKPGEKVQYLLTALTDEAAAEHRGQSE